MLESKEIPNGEDRILNLFDSGFGNAIPREERRGCLMCNAMIELGPVDETVAQLTAGMYSRIQLGIYHALKDANHTPLLDDDILMQKAVIITNLYFGAQAVSKSGQSAPDWHPLITAITRQ